MTTAAQETAVDDTPALRSIVASWRDSFAPPPALTVSEFADQHVIVTSGPLAGTRWQTAFAPYQRGILDAFHEEGVQTVVVQGSSQWGKTACAVNVVAYHIAHDPCPILVLEPTVDPMAKDFARNRLEPIIAATPILEKSVSKKRSKDASNTTLAKTFRGGSISIGGANSAASLAARTVRLLVLDEVDRWPPELPGEGSTIAIALKRTQAYRRRKRILMLSSPTLEGGPIHSWFQRGDQRRFYVPCPACGTMHPYEWRQVKWDHEDPLTARLECPACQHPINDAERVAILAGGEWRQEHPERRDKSIISFHLWEAYSPLSSLSEIVGGFLAARERQKAGDRSEMHTWQNTTLGEPVAPDDGEGVEPSGLLLRREVWPAGIDVPEGACCLTAGVDTHDDRLEALVIGWGPGEESWLIDRHDFPGDTSQPDVWRKLDGLLDLQYQHASGQKLMIQAMCIDSAGHRTNIVYDYVFAKRERGVYAIIGRDGQRPIMSSPSRKTWGHFGREVDLYTIGVDAAKALFVSRLRLTEKGPGYIHLPNTDWVDEELIAQFASERLVTKWHKGVPVQVWKQIRARNEGLDMFLYGIGALRRLNPNLPAMLDNLRRLSPAPTTPTPMRPSQRPRRVWTSDYLE